MVQISIEPVFFHLLRMADLPEPVVEYKFHPTLGWRFDYCWIAERVALEVEGGSWIHGRHNRAKGFQEDMLKYNEANCLGYHVLRCVPKELCDEKTIDMIKRCIAYTHKQLIRPFDQITATEAP